MPKFFIHIFRSFLFYIALCFFSFLIPALFLIPSLLFKSAKIADYGAKLWTKTIVFSLNIICGINYTIINSHNIPSSPCIFACKHQSMWETIIMHIIIHRPVYVYKTELLKIPFYGWFLNVMSGIKVNRKGGINSLKYVLQQAKHYLKKQQSIVIFPQGTRVPVSASIQQYPYQSGIVALYQNCNVSVVPVALNSGVFWSKKLFQQKPGTIVINFLPAIPSGLSKKDFIQTLTQQIEENSQQLAKNV